MRPSFLGIAAALNLLMPDVAAAQGSRQCGPHDPIVEGLQRDWNEVLIVRAVSDRSSGAIIELFASPGGTYTVLGTVGNVACVYDYGKKLLLEPCPGSKPLDKSI